MTNESDPTVGTPENPHLCCGWLNDREPCEWCADTGDEIDGRLTEGES